MNNSDETEKRVQAGTNGQSRPPLVAIPTGTDVDAPPASPPPVASAAATTTAPARSAARQSRRLPMLVAEDGEDLCIDLLDGENVARLSAMPNGQGQVMYTQRPRHVAFATVDDAEPIPTAKSAIARCPMMRRVLYRVGLRPETLGLSRRDLHLLLRVWFVAQLLRRSLPTRPIGVFHGPPGSGKTSAARMLGRLLLGSEFEVVTIPPTERDLAVAASATPYLVVDNAEHAPRWFAEALARMATGGKLVTRALHTDGKRATFRPDVFTAITSASAEWLTGYVLDRALIFHVVKVRQRLPELALHRLVDKARPDVLAEAIGVAADAHAWLTTKGPPSLMIVTDGKQKPVDLRLADFASVGWVVAEIMDGAGAGERFLAALLAMDAERRTFASGTDALLAALQEVAAMELPPMTSFELMDQLARVMGAAMYKKNVDDDPTKLGKAIAAIRTRAAGLVDIRVTHPRGTAKYEVRPT